MAVLRFFVSQARLGLGLLLSLVLVGACGSERSTQVRFAGDERLSINGLDQCDDFTTSPVDLDPERPVHVLVHGCYASSARLSHLARLFEAQGEQAVCFSYDDRGALEVGARRLSEVLGQLRSRMGSAPIKVLGHSQGGLVARRALTNRHSQAGLGPLQLVTVSSPFKGIEASNDCGKVGLHVVTLGITVAVCRAIAGRKWREIHPDATFIRQPGALAKGVGRHLKIVTDERGTCRTRGEDGDCEEDDFVFSLDEQYFDRIDAAPVVRNVEIRVGHAAVIGMDDRPPLQLLEVLRSHRVLRRLPPEQEESFRERATLLY
jgi:hypothetical protein